jgi:uracil-DNA glycosylase
MGRVVRMGKTLVWGEGPEPADEMLIGEAPGATEEREGRPFVGAAGKVLNEALANAGMMREDVYITNAYKYRPENNRNPTVAELNLHLPYLTQEFLAVDPARVLLLGRVASDWYSGFLGIPLVRGEWNQSGNSRLYYSAYHPAATIYNKDVKEEFFAQVYEFFNG